MIDNCLIFLVSLLALRTNSGLDEEQLIRLEMVSFFQSSFLSPHFISTF